MSREEVVYHKADELLEKLPADYVEEDYKAKIQKLGGLDKPLNIFLFQEIQRLQAVIGKVRFILKQLQLAINGEVVMTDEFQESLDKIADARVLQLWTYPSPATSSRGSCPRSACGSPLSCPATSRTARG